MQRAKAVPSNAADTDSSAGTYGASKIDRRLLEIVLADVRAGLPRLRIMRYARFRIRSY